MATNPSSDLCALTIEVPKDTAALIESQAKLQHRSVGEVLCDAFQEYQRKRLLQRIRDAAAYAATLPPSEYSADDVESIVDEIRSQRSTAEAG